jgi:hypothetical protein
MPHLAGRAAKYFCASTLDHYSFPSAQAERATAPELRPQASGLAETADFMCHVYERVLPFTRPF